MAIKQYSHIPRRGFMDGLASVLDLGANYTRYLNYRCRVPSSKRFSRDQDAQALNSDWVMVGHDIEIAISRSQNKD